MTGPYFIGIDVGTSSVRAALVSKTGQLVSTNTSAITILEPDTDFYEQSSDEIWHKVCNCVKVRKLNIHLWHSY